MPESGRAPGADTADIVRPRPASCAVLEDGDRELAKALGFSETQVLIRWSELSKLLREKCELVNQNKVDHAYLMYVEYIFMNAACDTKIFATGRATSNDKAPSASTSASSADDFMIGAVAFSKAGRKLSLWNENKASRPPNTILRSAAGTVLCPTPLSEVTGAEAGLM